MQLLKKGSENNVIGNGKKGNPCHIITETVICTHGEDRKKCLMALSPRKEISKRNAEDVVLFFLATCKMQGERNKLREELSN